MGSHFVFDLRPLHLYDEHRGWPPAIAVPFALPENPPRLRHRFEKALRGHVDAVFHTMSVPTGYFGMGGLRLL